MTFEEELSGLDRKGLTQKWCKIIGCEPPPRLGRPTMVRILVCELQWKKSPESRAAIKRSLQRVLERSQSSNPRAPSGSRLIREWNGKRHIVDVSDEGYVWRGKTWRSLSAIAKEITGTKWSGPRFFGVSG